MKNSHQKWELTRLCVMLYHWQGPTVLPEQGAATSAGFQHSADRWSMEDVNASAGSRQDETTGLARLCQMRHLSSTSTRQNLLPESQQHWQKRASSPAVKVVLGSPFHELCHSSLPETAGTQGRLSPVWYLGISVLNRAQNSSLACRPLYFSHTVIISLPPKHRHILPFLLVGLLSAHARTLLQYFKCYIINNKYIFLLISSKRGRKMGTPHTPVSIDQAVFPDLKFIPENHCSNNAQVKIKELRIISTFDLAASKNDFVKGNTICSKNVGFNCF